MSTTDRIEKRMTLRAPLERVWKAITDAREFGKWFGVELDGEFTPGRTMTGTWSGESTEEMIIEAQKRAGLTPSKVKFPGPHAVFCTVGRIEPKRYFSFWWIPYSIDADSDPEREPKTLVEFHLEAVAEGTLVTIVESGFDRVPPHRRERAFRMNEGGWTGQAQNLRKYVEG
jgi:uncharacterized protein YndB with AHSA1/START domain